MYCTKCGKQIEDGASFCASCGMRVIGKVQAQPDTDKSAKSADGAVTPVTYVGGDVGTALGTSGSANDTAGGWEYKAPSAGGTGAKPGDARSFGWAVLGFFIPVVGLILYLAWKNEYPLRARSAGVGAIIGFVIEIVLAIIVSIVFYEEVLEWLHYWQAR